MAKSILYLTGTYPQASETFIEQDMQLLLENDVPIIPVAIFPGDGDGAIQNISYLSASSGAPVPNEIRSKLKDLIRGPLRKHLALRKHQDKLSILSNLIEEHSVDHLHAAFGGLPALLCAEASKKHLLPYSVSVHANDILCSSYDDEALLSAADNVFACNQRTINEVIKRSPWTAEKFSFVPHGLRLPQWPFSSPTEFNTPVRFLFVGRLTEKKDPFKARDLVRALDSSGIPATITFAGDGPVRSEDMDVTGFVSRDAIRSEMQRSDFLLCTSIERPDGDMEGIPNVILEAMATGLPVIAPLTGGIGEVLNEATGYPIDPQDTKQFISLIASLVGDAEGVAKRAEAARELVCERFSAERAILEKVNYFSSI